MSAISLFLLLLFHLSLGHEDTPVIDASTDPCKCETRIFDVDEMNETMKFKQSSRCPRPCTYLYYIKPLPDYIVSLEDKNIYAEVALGTFKSSYYMGEKDEIDMIPMSYGDMFQMVSDTPPGVGVFVNYTIPANIVTQLDFTVHFQRIPVSEARKICPPPVLNVTSTKQVISTANWPKKGCAFRVQSEKAALTMHSTNILSFQGNKMFLFWERNPVTPKLDLFSNDVFAYGAWFTLDSGTDILHLPAVHHYSEESPVPGACELSFIALDYNPCNCSTTNFTLGTYQTITLKSPGYPEMFCPKVHCHYTVNLTQKEDDDHMNTFVVKTLHFPRGGKENLYFTVDEEEVQLEEWSGNQSYKNVLTGETLEIDYTALSVLSSQHGFSMTITAVTQPHDCRCPANNRKIFTEDDGSFEMSIPPYCIEMMCNFVVEHSSKQNQIVHVEYDYTFYSAEMIINTASLELTSTSKPEHLSRDITAVNGTMRNLYFRTRGLQESNETSTFKMKWNWMTVDECSCGETSFKATDRWFPFYSPRYPIDYCNNLNCTYSFEAPKGHHIKFMINNFGTEPHRDFLRVYEAEKMLGQFSGHSTKSAILDTEGRYGTVTFQSDASVVAKGFVVFFYAVPDLDFIPQDVREYLGRIAIEAIIFILVLLVALCFFLAYKKKFFKRSTVAIENPAYSFSTKSDEIVVIDVVDKE